MDVSLDNSIKCAFENISLREQLAMVEESTQADVWLPGYKNAINFVALFKFYNRKNKKKSRIMCCLKQP